MLADEQQQRDGGASYFGGKIFRQSGLRRFVGPPLYSRRVSLARLLRIRQAG